MAFQYITNYTSPSYTPAASVPYVFGQARKVKSITIHHWGVFGQNFYGVASYLCRAGGNSSAHYVVQDGLVACLVDPDDAAWHAGNAVGAATSIGIECRPEATEGDYRTTAELIRNLRAVYGDVPLVPHRDWTSTACPGIWDLAKLDRMARSGASSAPVVAPPKPAPVSPVQPSTGLVPKVISQSVAWVRTAPSHTAPKASAYPNGIAKGATILVSGYVKGSDPFGTNDNAWMKTKSGFYVWANAAGNVINDLNYLGDMSGKTAGASPAPQKKLMVTLPASAQRWGVYRLGVAPVVANISGYLAPAQFGGLTYHIESWVIPNQVGIITTKTFGRVQIYIAPGTGAKIFAQ